MPRIAPIVLAVLIAGVPASRSHAAAPAPATSEAGSPAEPDMRRYRELLDLGEQQFDLSEFNTALEYWTEAYEILPSSSAFEVDRALLRALIANAHEQAYAIDHEVEHLYKIRALLEAQLDELGSADGSVRADLEARLGAIEHSIEEVEREQAEREHALSEAELRAREEATREAELERIVRDKQVREDRKYRTMGALGWVSIGLGFASAGGLIAGVVLGERVDRLGQNATLDPDIPDSERLDRLTALRDVGRIYNGVAIGAGIATGVFLVTGISLRAAVKRRYKDTKFGRLSPSPGGLVLAF